MASFEIPAVSGLCTEYPSAPGELCIQMPGGAQLCAQVGFDSGDLTAITASVLGSLNASLMPLVPIFNVLDVVKAIFDVVKAVPGLIGPPPDPVGFGKALGHLVQAIDKLVKLLPFMCIPALIKSILDVLINGLLGIKLDIQAMFGAQARLLAAAQKAAALGNVSLQDIVDCANANLEIMLANKNAAIAPLNRLIGLINFFMDLVGLGCIPVLGSLETLSQALIEPLDAAVSILQKIRDALTLGLGGDALPSPCT